MAAKNRLILGLMTIGPDAALGARITDLNEYKKCLDYLASKGYNELDSAAVYVGGTQEGFTRDAGFKERGFRIASKIMPQGPRAHAPEKLPAAWDKSLQNLGIDCADIVSAELPYSRLILCLTLVQFYLHAPDRTTSYEETMECVDKMHKAGKFKQLGLSNYAAWEVAELVGICERRGFVKPTIYQGMYNAISKFVSTCNL